MTELNIIKIGKDDKSISDEAAKGIFKALGEFLEPTIDAIKERLANKVRSPQQRSLAVILDVITKLEKAGLIDDIKEIPYDIKTMIFNGIEFGNQTEEIQSKWKKLLEASITGKPVRKDYAILMDTLEPVEARLLDTVYLTIKKYKSLTVLSVEELIEKLGIVGYEEELLISINKLSKHSLSPLECNFLSKAIKAHYKYDREILIENLKTIKQDHPFDGLIIEDRAEILPGESKDYPAHEDYKILTLSQIGMGFMKIVSEQ